MRSFRKSSKLDNVCYEIRGPVLEEAKRLEAAGHAIIKLNTGNPPAFGLMAPDKILGDTIANLPAAEAYCDSKGILPAREAIAGYCRGRGIGGVDIEDVYIGNGVSEMIVMAMQGLLDDGDEVLVPMPDYPLWTAAVNLAGGRAVHYVCDEAAGWLPDPAAMEKQITPRTKGIVIINPNNPTGAVYPRDLLERIVALAVKNGLILYSDEIYDRLLYDGLEHVATASLTDEVPCVTFNGLSKSHCVPGFRAGWMTLSGNQGAAKDYIEGLGILATMRLCGNVQSQFAIRTALGDETALRALLAPGGRLREQRDLAFKIFNEIPGLSCVKPKAALYCFPKIDTARFNITDDQQFCLDFLRAKHVLLVQGTGFNWPTPDHFRVVFLPDPAQMAEVGTRMADFLAGYKQAKN